MRVVLIARRHVGDVSPATVSAAREQAALVQHVQTDSSPEDMDADEFGAPWPGSSDADMVDANTTIHE